MEQNDNQLNIVMDIINGILSFVVIIEYIYSTYDPYLWRSYQWGTINLFIHFYFLIEYTLRIYGSKDMQKYIKSGESIVEIISIFPFMLVRLSMTEILIEDNEQNIINAVNIMSLFRILRFERWINYLETDISKQLLYIVIQILTLVAVASASTQFLQRYKEPNPDNKEEQLLYSYPYHYYVYFIMTIISTEGYENKLQSSLSRFLVIILLFFAIIFVPSKSGKLISLLSSKSYYARRVYKAVQSIPHIVVTGVVSPTAADDFFKELFHEDHGSQEKHAVMLIPHGPDSQMDSLLINQNLIYLEGDSLNEKDLKRCQLEKAKSIVILCNKQSIDPHKEDARTILQAMVMKKYLSNAKAGNVRFCMQLLRQEGKTHYYLSVNRQTRHDQVICIEELKMSLLAKSCLCPGFIAVVTNLITSSSSLPQSHNLEYQWLEDYWKGRGYEIYKTLLSQRFQGVSFSEIALIIYKNYGAILFAIEVVSQDGESQIYLNPGQYMIPEDQKVYGYIISEDKKVADTIANYKNEDFDVGKWRQIQREFNEKQNQQSTQQFNRSKLKSMSKQYFRSELMELNTLNTLGVADLMQDYSQELDENNEIINDEQGQHDEFSLFQQKQESYKSFLTGEWSHIADKCHMTKEKVNLMDVTFYSLEKNILAMNHIILCGMAHNLINFIIPLRSKYLLKYPTIVILHNEPPTEKIWNQIAFFPEVYYISGSALVEKDLFRANIKQAAKVVILAPSLSEIDSFQVNDQQQQNDDSDQQKSEGSKIVFNELSKDNEDLLDARTIFKYKIIKRLRSDIQIVTELVNQQNLEFLVDNLKDFDIMKKYGYSHTPIFASGEIYLSSIMDSLCSQAFFNTAIITVLNLLLLGTSGNQQSNLNNRQKQLKKLKTLSQTKQSADQIKNSNLFQIPVPKAFIGQEIQQLFSYCTKKQNVIVLGLYRLQNCKDNKLPYVWTNPDPNVVLTEKDLLMILSQEKPTTDSYFWGGPLELNQQQQIEILSQKNAETNIDLNTSSTNIDQQDMFLNYEDLDKDTLKARQNQKEQELLQQKINETIDNLLQLKQDTITLEQNVKSRQQYLLDQIKFIFNDELQNMSNKKQQTQQNSKSGDNSPSNGVEEIQQNNEINLIKNKKLSDSGNQNVQK